MNNRTSRNRFYLKLCILLVLGVIWCMYNRFTPESYRLVWFYCPFKQITHLPCPACGTTRGILAFLRGDFSQALLSYNALCVVELPLLLLTTLWLSFDIVTGGNGLYQAWIRLNVYLCRKIVLILVLSVIAINWVWNLMKGL